MSRTPVAERLRHGGRRLAPILMLIRMALGNLVASRMKTLIMGGIIFAGAAAITVGSSVVAAGAEALSGSVVGSAAGHIQLYSARSKDDLDLFGGSKEPRLEEIEDFAVVKKAVLTVDNVRSILPMGVVRGRVMLGSDLDIALVRLRAAVRRKLGGDTSRATQGQLDAAKAHLRHLLSVVSAELARRRSIQDDRTMTATNGAAALRQASAESFWIGFAEDPLSVLEFLDNQVAPLVTADDDPELRWLGTDPQEFARSFDRFRLVEGGLIPPGARGLLINRFSHERAFKVKVARRLDRIREGLEVRRLTIRHSGELSNLVRENRQQLESVLYQLDAERAGQALALIRDELGVTQGDLPSLLPQLLDLNDANFSRRYRFFYDRLAPLLDLYRVHVGDTIIVKSITASGRAKATKLRVYGLFEFQGLEGSALAGSLSLMDLVSFRELHGALTARKAAELRQLTEREAIQHLRREDVEAALFGGPELTPGATRPSPPDKPLVATSPSPASEMESGMVLNAAVILRDPSQLERSLAQIDDALLAAKLDLAAIPWHKAAGLVGQVVDLLRVVLVVATGIIFLVALIIIQNALVLATLQRVPELGTLRALGAQRTTVVALVMIEALAVAVAFGAQGAAVGAGLVSWLGHTGLPVGSGPAISFFAGSHLRPVIDLFNVATAVGAMVLISGLASLYPLWIALRVSPRQAMAAVET